MKLILKKKLLLFFTLTVWTAHSTSISGSLYQIYSRVGCRTTFAQSCLAFYSFWTWDSSLYCKTRYVKGDKAVEWREFGLLYLVCTFALILSSTRSESQHSKKFGTRQGITSGLIDTAEVEMKKTTEKGRKGHEQKTQSTKKNTKEPPKHELLFPRVLAA